MHGVSNKEALSTLKISMELQTDEDLRLIHLGIQYDLIQDKSMALIFTRWSSLTVIRPKIIATPLGMYSNLIGTQNK